MVSPPNGIAALKVKRTYICSSLTSQQAASLSQNWRLFTAVAYFLSSGEAKRRYTQRFEDTLLGIIVGWIFRNSDVGEANIIPDDNHQPAEQSVRWMTALVTLTTPQNFSSVYIAAAAVAV